MVLILDKIYHLGKNPIKGGNPPKDNKFKIKHIYILGVKIFSIVVSGLDILFIKKEIINNEIE